MDFPSNKKSIHEALAESQNKLIEHLQSSEKRYSNLVENLRDTVFQLDTEFRWSFVNRAGSIMTGFEAGQVLNREFIEHVAVQDTQRCLGHFRSLISGKTREVSDRITYQRADGVERVFELACRAMKDEAESYNGIAGTLTDITERLKTENKVIHMAYHDSLTGLANRRLLHDYLKKTPDPLFKPLLYGATLPRY